MALESIALIPSGVKATKVYSQLPVNGNGDFTFDRGTSTDQTRVNKNGLIENVAQDVPRLDYLDGGCPSLLLEPSSTNLITYSEEFDNVAWSTNNLSVSANELLSPDGSVNADKLTNTATSSNSYIFQLVSLSTNTDYSVSIFAKKGDSNIIEIDVWDTINAIQGRVAFDFDNKTTSNEIGSSSFDDYGNGWYRIKINFTTDASLGVSYIRVWQKDDSVTNKYFYIFGAQLEQQSYATSYIPTSGATATRDAETCNSAGTTDEIGQEGIIYIEKKAFANDGTNRIYGINKSGVGFNDSVILRYATSDNRITAQTRVGGVYSFQLNHDLLDALIYNKIAFKYKQDDFALYVNGLLVGVGTGNVSAGLDNFGFSFVGGNHLYGKVKKLSIYNDTTQDLEQLTGFTSFAEMSSYLSYS